MSEKFSKNKKSEKRNRLINGAFFGCAGIFVFPIFGTAITKTQIADHASFLSNAGFIFSLFIIPLIFFGLYKLDRAVEKRVPKRGDEKAINGSGDNLLRES